MPTRLAKNVSLVAVVGFLAAGQVRAQTDKPRFVILLDNSTSMSQNPSGIQTHGDGSESQPGCDLDGKSTAGWAYDDSKLFLAKAAVIDTISAFGSAEFALATYSRVALGQSCTQNTDCTALVAGAACVGVPGGAPVQQVCAFNGGDSYLECQPPGGGCTRCANPADTNAYVYDWGAFDCIYAKCSYAQGCMGGQVLVPFPATGASNLGAIYQWIDGKEDLPPFVASSNREIRAVTMTPLASALESVGGWLTDSSKTSIGPGAGLLSTNVAFRDARAACRPYNVILITDGEDTCSPNPTNDPVLAAASVFGAGVNVYVVGFGTGFSTVLNNMAMAGSGQKQPAYFVSDRSELTANLGNIIMNAIPQPKCNCDATCYDEKAAFPLKGQSCTVGVGRCKRQGVYACNSTGDGVMCATSAVCGATPLVAGTPAAEQCGTLAGCQAPTAADCADENCNGEIDEGLSCFCASKPEVCNGLDDNCNGLVDDIPRVSCGLDLGACKAGITVCGSDGAGGQKVVCQGEVGPTPEVCDGIDNDCNGIVDEFARSCFPAGVSGCTYDATALKWNCTGACQPGLQVCSAGAWQACVGAVTPIAEIACDGVDNNCDGKIDEADPISTDRCYPTNAVGCDTTTGKCVGVCSFGAYQCSSNKLGLSCAGAHIPSPELCNGKDDDCDGLVDEDFPTLGQPCNETSCQGAGKLVCNAAGTNVECTVTAQGPTLEICDGLDNDCDGQIDEAPQPGEPAMPGVGLACGSGVGECVAGTSQCVGGKIVCSGVGPTPEICDGKDNDCNGSFDDNLVPPGDTCNPDGMAPGQAMAGECRPGTFACKGALGWKCVGGVGPSPEICDGKDNDCDGQIDNNAQCAVGYVCTGGECVAQCHEGGEQYQPCPADRFCKGGICLIRACAQKPCAAGLLCLEDGTCADPCSLVTCLPGASCVKGVCVDCYSQGCPSGQRCIERQCQIDLCAQTHCAAGTFCEDGVCTPSCANVVCKSSQVCKQGQCVSSACSGTCSSGLYCDGTTSSCQSNRCAGISCPAGRACVGSTGQCILDPCEHVRCGAGQLCSVGSDGIADCASPLPSGVPKQVAVSGKGLFGCSFDPGASHVRLAEILFAFLATSLCFVRGRRRRPQGN